MEHPAKPAVFISYSHADQKWLNELLTHLKPLKERNLLDCWSDREILAGGHWRRDIEQALSSAKVAILLVSPEFLASDFISKNELPPLLKAANNGDMEILWIPVGANNYKHTELAEFQAAHPPEKPLNSLRKAARQKALVEISDRILMAVSASTAEAPTGTTSREVPQVGANRQATSEPFAKRVLQSGNRGMPLVERLMAAVLGFGFLAVLAYAGLRDRPIVDPGQLLFLRVVASVSSAACAAIIPGFIDVRFRGWLRAGGSIAVFAIIWFTDPPQRVSPKNEAPRRSSAGAAGNFTFNCGAIEDIPIEAKIGIDVGEHIVNAYSSTLRLIGVQTLKLNETGKEQAVVRNNLEAIQFDPLPAKPSAALEIDTFSSQIKVGFSPGSTLRAHQCDTWSAGCTSLEIVGQWVAEFSAARLGISMQRYSTKDTELIGPDSKSDIEATSQPVLFAELSGEAGSSIVISSHQREMALPMYDHKISESGDLKFSDCSSISGTGTDGFDLFYLTPGASTVVVTTPAVLKIVSLRTACKQHACSFILKAEGSISSVRQHNFPLWESVH